jgi:hypothetical protein
MYRIVFPAVSLISGSVLVLAACSSPDSPSGSGGGGPISAGGSSAGGSTTGGAGPDPGVGSGGASSNGTAGTIAPGGTGGTMSTTTGGGGGAGGGSGAGGSGAPPIACTPPLVNDAGTATAVNVDLGATPIATISSDLMGVHTAVYDDDLVRPSTATLLKAAGVTSLRYPGGSYADLYHWETHTGTTTPAQGAGSNVIYVAPEANMGRFVSVLKEVGANAFITVNYGMNSRATGPGSPKEAAAWVAYANGTPTDNTVIGSDNSVPSVDFKTVGYWAGLRASAPLATDDGKNFLRINHPAPVGIKLWEVGNELYGNGFYGGTGWEADFHVLYDGTTRTDHTALSPATYGSGVVAFATAMKAVDPTIKVGGVLSWGDQDPSFNVPVLKAACAAMDFAAIHYYPGNTIASLYTHPKNDIPGMFSWLHEIMAANCPAGANAKMPIAVTEWGPQTLYGGAVIGDTWHPKSGTPRDTQVGGIFAAEAYANFMEEGALAVHWAQLHDNQYLLPTPMPDTPGFGYQGQLIAHYLGAGGDQALPEPSSSSPSVLAHATRRPDGSIGVMLTNIDTTATAAVTLAVTSSRPLACSGTRYAYTPVAGNNSGPVSAGDPISSTSTATGSTVQVSVPAQAVVVVRFAVQ